MHALITAIKVLAAFLAFSLVVGSMSKDFAAPLVGLPRYELCLMVFGSVLFLHLLIWRSIVSDSAILGRDPKSFVTFGQSKTSFSGLTAFGYVLVALHCLKIAGFPPNVNLTLSVTEYERIYVLSTGLLLIGIGLTARLRLLFRELAAHRL